MTCLLMRLEGPMQSWGSHSRFLERDTEREPTKSGVVGLIGAALGKPREEREGDGFPTLSELASMPMGVRVDREGRVERDFHAAGGGGWPDVPKFGVPKADPSKPRQAVISNRYYLTDASFLVGVEGDRALLQRIQDALKEPRYPLALGRRAFPPGASVWLEDGLREEPLEAALRAYPFDDGGRTSGTARRRRLILETADVHDGEERMDVPVCFEIRARSYAPRYVKSFWIEGDDMEGGES